MANAPGSSGQGIRDEVKSMFAEYSSCEVKIQRVIQQMEEFDKLKRKEIPTPEVLEARQKIHGAKLELIRKMEETDAYFQSFVCFIQRPVFKQEVRQKLSERKSLLKKLGRLATTLERLLKELIGIPIPPEVWLKIFDNVKDPEDFNSVINSSQWWSDLLHNQKTVRLFSLVFPFVFLTNRHLFSVSELLPLRLVHSEWKRGIDQLLCTHNYLVYCRNGIFSEGYGSGVSPLLLDLISSLPPGPNSNPFLGSHAHAGRIPVHGDRIPFPYQMDERVFTIFENYGHHIKTMVLSVLGLTPEQLYRILQTLQNLEKLDVVDRSYQWVSDQTLPLVWLPRLPRLSHMSLSIGSRERRELFLSNYGESLTSFYCDWNLLNIFRVGQLLPNLKKLQLSEIRRISPAHLRTLSQVPWKLEDLRIYGIGVELTAELVAAVSNFSETLNYLMLHFNLTQKVEPQMMLGLRVFRRLENLVLYVRFPDIQAVPLSTQVILASVCPVLKTLFFGIENREVLDKVRLEMKTGVFSNLVRRLTKLQIVYRKAR